MPTMKGIGKDGRPYIVEVVNVVESRPVFRRWEKPLYSKSKKVPLGKERFAWLSSYILPSKPGLPSKLVFTLSVGRSSTRFVLDTPADMPSLLLEMLDFTREVLPDAERVLSCQTHAETAPAWTPAMGYAERSSGRPR